MSTTPVGLVGYNQSSSSSAGGIIGAQEISSSNQQYNPLNTTAADENDNDDSPRYDPVISTGNMNARTYRLTPGEESSPGDEDHFI
jgi:hypothetical protein